MQPNFPRSRPLALAVAAAMTSLLGGCFGDSDPSYEQPTLDVRVKKIVGESGYEFRDLNGNGSVDPYEDWRKPIDARVDDLVARMTLEEKAGLMLIQTLNGGCAGAAPALADNYIGVQMMHRFIFRNVVDAVGTCAADADNDAGQT